MSETYTCAVCGRTYLPGWTEAEAEAEMRSVYGSTVRKEECAVLCEDCYRDVMEWMAKGAAQA